MAQVFKIKNSQVEGKIPDPENLAVAELAVNLKDKKLYTKNADNAVIELMGSGGGGNSSPTVELLPFDHTSDESWRPWAWINGSRYENLPDNLDSWFRGISNIWTPARPTWVTSVSSVYKFANSEGTGIFFDATTKSYQDDHVYSLNFKISNAESCLLTIVFNVTGPRDTQNITDFYVSASFSGGSIINQTPSEQYIKKSKDATLDMQYVVSGICVDSNIDKLTLNITFEEGNNRFAASQFQLASYVLTKPITQPENIDQLDASGRCPYKALPPPVDEMGEAQGPDS